MWFFVELEEAVRKKPPALSDGGSLLVILKKRANQEGLTEDQITRLVQVATSKKYSEYSLGNVNYRALVTYLSLNHTPVPLSP